MSNFDNNQPMQAVIVHQDPPEGQSMTHYSLDLISSSLPHSLPLETWAFQLGYTHGYIWTNSQGTRLLTLTGRPA